MNEPLPTADYDAPTVKQCGLCTGLGHTTDEHIEHITDVIVQHQRIPMYDGSGGYRCVGCDHLRGELDGPNSPRHARHVAEQIARVLPPVVSGGER